MSEETDEFGFLILKLKQSNDLRNLESQFEPLSICEESTVHEVVLQEIASVNIQEKEREEVTNFVTPSDEQHVNETNEAIWLEEYDEGENCKDDANENLAQEQDSRITRNKHRKDPAYIPRQGYYYEHDSRFTGWDTLDDQSVITLRKEEFRLDKEPNKPVRRGSKSAFAKKDQWQHDCYDEEEQAPLSREELVYKYGYDIRKESDYDSFQQNQKMQRQYKRDGMRRSYNRSPRYPSHSNSIKKDEYYDGNQRFQKSGHSREMEGIKSEKNNSAGDIGKSYSKSRPVKKFISQPKPNDEYAIEVFDNASEEITAPHESQSSRAPLQQSRETSAKSFVKAKDIQHSNQNRQVFRDSNENKSHHKPRYGHEQNYPKEQEQEKQHKFLSFYDSSYQVI